MKRIIAIATAISLMLTLAACSSRKNNWPWVNGLPTSGEIKTDAPETDATETDDTEDVSSPTLDQPTPDKIVTFIDADFENMFRMMNNHTGNIYESDLLALRKLDLGRHHLKNISDVAKFKNLIDLALSGNNISDISALKDLTQLTIFGLSWNNISDISMLKNLKKLTFLSLLNNPLTSEQKSELWQALPNCDISFSRSNF